VTIASSLDARRASNASSISISRISPKNENARRRLDPLAGVRNNYLEALAYKPFISEEKTPLAVV
jgi:hypothetical protein